MKFAYGEKYILKRNKKINNMNGLAQYTNCTRRLGYLAANAIQSNHNVVISGEN